jgi:ribonuclease HI
MTYIEINTDGACIVNTGRGGWAGTIRRFSDGVEVKCIILHGAVPATTNNRMKLTAAIKALERIRRDETSQIKVRSDSEYLVNGMNEWLEGWKARNWRGSAGKPLKNKELWLRLNDLSKGLQISWEWVKGNSGDRANEEVDAIAQTEAQNTFARKTA